MVAGNSISGKASISGAGSMSAFAGYSADLSVINSPFTGALFTSNTLQFLASPPNGINSSTWPTSTNRGITVSGCSGIYSGLNGQSFYLINNGSSLLENGNYSTFVSNNSLAGMLTTDIPGFTLNWI